MGRVPVLVLNSRSSALRQADMSGFFLSKMTSEPLAFGLWISAQCKVIMLIKGYDINLSKKKKKTAFCVAWTHSFVLLDDALLICLYRKCVIGYYIEIL